MLVKASVHGYEAAGHIASLHSQSVNKERHRERDREKQKNRDRDRERDIQRQREGHKERERGRGEPQPIHNPINIKSRYFLFLNLMNSKHLN